MGYLNHDSNTVIVDAVLTKKGRELLSKGNLGDGGFKITKFAVADDEVDYTLWNPDHTSGSNYYGEVVENLPLLEANVNESKAMRYKLITLDKESLYMAWIETIPNQTMSSTQTSLTIVPSTSNDLDKAVGYTMVIDDSTVCTVVGTGAEVNTGGSLTSGMDASSTSVTAVGTEFVITPKIQAAGERIANVTVVGNASGATTTFTVTVQQFVDTNATAAV